MNHESCEGCKWYLKAFERMLKEREYKRDEMTWQTAEDVFDWWTGGRTGK